MNLIRFYVAFLFIVLAQDNFFGAAPSLAPKVAPSASAMALSNFFFGAAPAPSANSF
jgi:hypothetical protein